MHHHVFRMFRSPLRENQPVNDPDNSSDEDLIATEDPTASVNARTSDADKNA
ncbi:hypothetical protein E4U58_006881 [Claviceps cyperi]|nr:hypothetical protein E4U58_006881 [Claviceps cyperi]